MYQSDVGKLWSKACILRQQFSQRRSVQSGERKQLDESRVNALEQACDRLGRAAQQPSRFCNDGPAREKWSGQIMEGGDTDIVILVISGKNCDQRAGVN